MANPMLSQLGKANTQAMMGGINNVKQAFGAIKSMGNPQILINKAISQNPELKAVLDECGGDYQKAFYRAAEMKGVNPDEILSQLR